MILRFRVMKKLYFINAIILALTIGFAFSTARAQNEAPPNADAPNQKNAKIRRPNLLAELGLMPEQIRQIRRINAERKPSMRAAQQHLREANRNLDQAIYADNADETQIQTLIKEVQTAQIEVIKLRSLTELAVRRVLTAEQLSKFRELRRRFMEQTENQTNQPENPRMKLQNRRFGNRQRALPPN